MNMLKTHRLIARPLSAQGFAPYGLHVQQPERSPDWTASGSRVEGVFEALAPTGREVARLWRLADLDYGGDIPYVGFVVYFHQGFRVAQLERHQSETQTWLARRGTSFIVVAQPTEPGFVPAPDDIAAFVVEPGDLISLRRGAWMCHFFPLGEEAEYVVLTGRRAPEQDRDLVDLRSTASTVLEITLA